MAGAIYQCSHGSIGEGGGLIYRVICWFESNWEYHLDSRLICSYLQWMEIEKVYFPHLYSEFKRLGPDEIDSWYTEVYDRWTWETNSAEDRDLLEKLDVERHYRKDAKNRSRKLSASWTVEVQQDLVSDIGRDVEEELIAAAAKEISKEIDEEILRNIMPS